MIQYFGTSLTEAGHYFWELQSNNMYSSHVRFSDLPFNPEGLPYKEKGQPYQNGLTQFHVFCGFSILAIEGSCRDSRPGSKSIFFIKEVLSIDQIIEKINSTPIARKIIDKMPFPVAAFTSINQ